MSINFSVPDLDLVVGDDRSVVAHVEVEVVRNNAVRAPVALLVGPDVVDDGVGLLVSGEVTESRVVAVALALNSGVLEATVGQKLVRLVGGLGVEVSTQEGCFGARLHLAHDQLSQLSSGSHTLVVKVGVQHFDSLAIVLQLQNHCGDDSLECCVPTLGWHVRRGTEPVSLLLNCIPIGGSPENRRIFTLVLAVSSADSVVVPLVFVLQVQVSQDILQLVAKHLLQAHHRGTGLGVEPDTLSNQRSSLAPSMLSRNKVLVVVTDVVGVKSELHGVSSRKSNIKNHKKSGGDKNKC